MKWKWFRLVPEEAPSLTDQCYRDLHAAVIAYLKEFDNKVPDGVHRHHLRQHLRKLVGMIQ